MKEIHVIYGTDVRQCGSDLLVGFPEGLAANVRRFEEKMVGEPVCQFKVRCAGMLEEKRKWG